ncbi:hypothetical protein [Cognatiluteimonas telluris]|jgi:hypothetical protein|uniref:hypothetical protein n=1 Tax=Cognatiluteimonas telluris TaxID=1104775 RepID=UPI001408F78F|nr:hypothetical protein [Lysobacter telluris]
MSNAPLKEEDQLARFGEELKDGTWLANARQRSQRRKSAWNLLLPLFGFPLWGVIAASLAWLASSLHTTLYPTASHLFGAGPMRPNTALVLVPALIAAVCPALLLTNIVVYLIPPARRAMDTEDRDYPGTGYNASQLALRKAALWAFAVCVPVILAGVCLQ